MYILLYLLIYHIFLLFINLQIFEEIKKKQTSLNYRLLRKKFLTNRKIWRRFTTTNYQQLQKLNIESFILTQRYNKKLTKINNSNSCLNLGLKITIVLHIMYIINLNKKLFKIRFLYKLGNLSMEKRTYKKIILQIMLILIIIIISFRIVIVIIIVII